MTLAAGTRLGPYEIVAALGAGGMGEVYRARDTRLGREVALKVLHERVQADPERLRHFETEARVTGALNHPNILALFDVGRQDGVPYVIAELLEGQTLGERLKDGRLSPRKALDVARQMAEGLAAAHAKGVVHRDLKPENVFLTRDGRVKLLDFGLARLRDEQAPGAGADDGLTHGRVLGTLGYMSPEQVRGEPADERSDIFSFGAVLYEMLSGRRAFKGSTAIETMNGILNDDPPQLEHLQPGLPPGLERVVRHCLEKAPEQRFQSARDLAFDLEAPASGLSLPPLGVLTGRGRRRLLGLGLCAFLAGVLLATAVAWLWPRENPGVPAFQRLTFRRGTIEEARFAPDGQTVVYGAAWAGAPVAVFSARLDSPESRALGFDGTELLGLSARGEMALALGRRRIGTFVGSGTLARATLAGGAPRELQEDVQAAAWLPDGSDLAIVRSVSGRNRLEFPIGRVLFETAGWVSHPRFAPDGRRLAFIEHPVWGDDGGHVAVVDLLGRSRRLSRNWGSLQGLAWRPDGGEVWFTGTRAGAARALQAVTLDGRERALLRVAGVLTLHDLTADGRALISHHVVRRELVVKAPGAERERDLSWLDYCFPSDFAEDGGSVFFAENGEGGGPGYSVWLRKSDGSPAVRLGSGAAMALSPDRRWALANRDYTTDEPQLVLLPSGAGQPRELPRGNVRTQAATFFPDGSALLLAGSEPGQATRTYVQDLEGGAPRALTPPGTRFALAAKPMAPDGRRALLRDADGRHQLFPVDGGPPQPVAGLEPADEPIRWSADGRQVYAYRPGEVPARVFRLDLQSGRREPWLAVQPTDLAGVLAVNPVQLTPDGRGYVYGYRRVLSDLYVVTGLR